MPSITELGHIFKTIREIDLQAIADEAQQQTWLAIVGDANGGARDLATALYLAPRPLPPEDACHDMAGPILVGIEQPELAERADLIIFVLEPGTPAGEPWRAAYQKWLAAGKQMIVIFNQPPVGNALLAPNEWMGARVLAGSVVTRDFLEEHFVPVVLKLLPDRKLSLGRNYPLLRNAVAHDLINETSFANASYSFSTGIAEIIPALTIPFNVADMVILTKAQAFMIYRLGLVFGLSSHWQDHLAAFGSTVGFGFVWRTIARQLVGLVPGFGVIPKVAIAYAGTYAIGRGALQWYETGRAVSRADIERFFREALEQGKRIAAALGERAPKPKPLKLGAPRLPFRKKKQDTILQLPAGERKG